MVEPSPMRILLVTRSYPAAGDLYKYPFVHRRVLAYVAAGQEVSVFCPSDRAGQHSFEGVACLAGDRDTLTAHAQAWRPDVVAVHGLSELMWPVVEPLAGQVPIRAWLHGSEIPAFFRQKAQCIADPEERELELQAVEVRRAFWQWLLGCNAARLKLVFVSNAAVDLAKVDLSGNLHADDYSVIPNPIDTELFRGEPKTSEDRWRVLMIRPFDSPTYGNDMAVAAILQMSRRSDFDRLSFTIIGDGPLFESTLKPVSAFPNVRIERRFLTQAEIAAQHAGHGIFLVPTRLDTQGVSRDEAMSSGLVPVTNLIPAVAEFVDSECASLAPANDAGALADGLLEMIEDPSIFVRRSVAAADRVRRQRSSKVIIPRELALLKAAVND